MYPNGVIKSREYFLSGVYRNNNLSFGPYTCYDKYGNESYCGILNPDFFSFHLGYYLGWLGNEIDKPTMRINGYFDPHAPIYGDYIPDRLSIRTNWTIQASDDDVSVAVLVHNRVYIFSKASRKILDNFSQD